MTRCIGTWMVALAAALGLLGWSNMAMAQATNNNGNTTNNFGQTAGVDVDAKGVLRYRVSEGVDGVVAKKMLAAAIAKLPEGLAKSSPHRKISLNRLEKAVKAAVESGKPVPAELKYLAGLVRIENVFFYPETGDIVIAGPAEPYGADASGRIIGLETGAATIELQDLIVALRAFPANSRGGDTRIQCSIDPTQEGLARLKNVIAEASRNQNAVVSNPAPYVDSMRNALGLQNVTVNGVSPETHFAQVLVEADYRMKMIGIGLEVPPKDVKIKSYVARASGNGSNALQRWWFVPNYECVKVTADGNGMELVGQGVKLIGESEYVAADGSRKGTGKVEGPSDGFAKNFTTEYPKIASRVPIYGQLKNVIDLSITAAFIQAQDYYGKSGWTAPLFNDEAAYAVETYHAPRQVETAINAVSKGPGKLVTPIGGGVDISPRQALSENNRMSDDQGTVAEKAKSVSLGGLAENQWWWD
jgi:hypothetical protein